MGVLKEVVLVEVVVLVEEVMVTLVELDDLKVDEDTGRIEVVEIVEVEGIHYGIINRSDKHYAGVGIPHL